MGAPLHPAGLTRRHFLGGAVTLVCAAPAVAALGCGEAGDGASNPPRIHGWPIPRRTELSAERYAALSAVMDALIPGDESSPGAVLSEAPFYLDQLLGAFHVDPPRIFAGGPYSGRHGGQDGFSRFQPLTRVEEIRWRTYLEGSQGQPEREFNGPFPGIRVLYERGLDALDVAARAAHGRDFCALDLGARQGLLQTTEPTFLSMLYEHAVEGTYGDPVYGGNAGQAGWRAIDYEGDRQPEGYTAAEMAGRDEG